MEQQMARNIVGPINFGNGVTIRGAVIGQYPEILRTIDVDNLAAIIGRHFNPDAKPGESYHNFEAIARDLTTTEGIL